MLRKQRVVEAGSVKAPDFHSLRKKSPSCHSEGGVSSRNLLFLAILAKSRFLTSLRNDIERLFRRLF